MLASSRRIEIVLLAVVALIVARPVFADATATPAAADGAKHTLKYKLKPDEVVRTKV